jgi:regulator of protease activity HflC (stomatin/prohibitin superfamily)
MNVKRIILACCICVVTTGCSYTSVDAGEEAVLIYKPYFFGHGGVDPTPVKTGATWTAWSTSVERYNVKPLKKQESFIDLTASDNVAIDFDVYLTLKVQDGKSPILHELSGRDWYSNKIKDTFRAFVRNEARTKTSIQLRTDEKTITETQDTIKDLISVYISDIGLPVSVTKVNIGKVVPPAEVLAEAAQTAAQKQRKQTQEQRKLAEDARAAAETASALADKAYSSEFKMTTDQFLRNKELDIMAKAAEKGQVSLIMNASNAQPMIRVGK